MASEATKFCVECQGAMFPVVLLDKIHHTGTPREFEYRQPDDSRSFWTGKYPTAGRVRAFLCEGCGRIALYGSGSETEPDAAH